MRKIILLQAFTFLCFLVNNAFSQEITIKGKVKDNLGSSVIAATVSLLKATDSSWIKSELVEDDGSFIIKTMEPGNYVLAITALGYENLKQNITIKMDNNKEVGIVMQKSSTILKEVSISAKKPFIELGMGKIVVNVENSITNTGNVLELLKKSPGVQVDDKGNISMHGKGGVLVLIDDRPTYLSADDLADYLKNMSQDEVAQLELISQPSAKYDAEGNSGIINIRTKKSRKQGWNGMASMTYSQGIYAGNWGSFQLNYYRNKLRLYTNTHYVVATGFADWTQTDRYLDSTTGKITGTNYMHSQPKETFSNTSVRIGADYECTKNTTTGISISGNYHPNTMPTNTQTIVADAGNITTLYTNRQVLDNSLKKNVSSNLYLKHSFAKDNELNISLDYINYPHFFAEDINSTDYNAQMQMQPDPLILRSNSILQTSVYSCKADYSITINKSLKIEAGIKSSLVDINNEADFTKFVNNIGTNDTDLTNHFLFIENINAAYLGCNKSIGDKWQIQSGLRAENDQVYGHQLVHDQSFTRNNIALFPTVYVSYKLNDAHQFEANYGRRVNRPGYGDLNPFKWFTFYNNYRIGNPELQLEYTSNFELKHNYKNNLITSLSYSKTINSINYATLTQGTSKTLYWTPENLASKQNISLSMTFNKLLLKWWNLSCSSDLYYSEYEGEVGEKIVDAKGLGCFFSMDSQFTISKEWSAELNAWYSGSSQGITTLNYPSGTFGFGVSRKVMKEAGSLKLSVYDPLGTSGASYLDRQYNFTSASSYYDNSRRSVSLSFNYNFGTKKDNSSRDNKQPDETKRMNM